MNQTERKAVQDVIETLENAYRVAPDTAAYKRGQTAQTPAAMILQALTDLRNLAPTDDKPNE